MIESIRKDKQAVLLLDCGAVFNDQKDNAELHLKAMERMGYDALNLGVPELSFGKEFLERTHSQVSFPYISSNLLEGGRRPFWLREYVIKEVGGVKVAILGVLDPEALQHIPNPGHVKGLEVIPPEVALSRLLPELRGKADLIVLLSQLGELGEQKTLALVEAVEGIDVAIFPERNYAVKPPEQETIILQTGFRGMAMGLLSITADAQGALGISERRDIPLDSSVSDNREILGLIETHKKEQEIQKSKRENELKEGLKLTPEEFFRSYQKKQKAS